MDVRPTVLVPENSKMATEPAMTIGKVFADKKLIQPAVAAAVALIASLTGWAADSDVVTNLTTLITFASVVWSITTAQLAVKSRAMAQAAETREAVYAPETVAQIVASSTPEVVDAVIIAPPPVAPQ